jgi:hypothetical protein
VTADRGLTPKEEAFAQAIVLGKSGIDSHRVAYPGRYSDKQRYEEASKLLARPKISQRVATLRAPVLERLRYGYWTAMTELGQAFEMAKANRNAAAMVSAVTLRAKLSGLLVEERKNNRDPFDGWTPEQVQEALVEVRKAIAKAGE